MCIRDRYEWNARNLITLWGTKCTEGENDDLNLYAYKEWQGMFSSYFRPRWAEFFARLNHSLDTNVPFDRAPFAADMCTCCLLYTSDAADERSSVDLGGRRIIK